MSINKAFLAGLGFVGLLFIVFMIEGVILYVDQDFFYPTSPSEEVLANVERLRLECSPYEQIQSSLIKFKEYIKENQAILGSNEAPKQKPKLPFYITDSLPKYEFSIVAANNEHEYSWQIDYPSDCQKAQNKKFFKSFLELLKNYIDENRLNLFIEKQFAKKIEKTDEEFAKYLGVKVAKTSFTSGRRNMLADYNSPDKSIGFFWNYHDLDKKRRLYYFCKLQLNKLSFNTEAFALKNAEESGIAAAFFYPEKHSLKVNRLYKELRGKSTIRAFEAACLKKAANNEFDSANSDSIELIEQNGFVCAIGCALFDRKAIPIVIKKLPEAKLWKYTALQTAAGLICLFITFSLFIQTAVFRRGIRLNVRRVIIICTFMTMLIPILAGQTLFKLVLEEQAATEQMQLERSTSNTLSAIDASVKLSGSNLIQGYQRAAYKSKTINELQKLNRLKEGPNKSQQQNENDETEEAEENNTTEIEETERLLCDIQKEAYSFMIDPKEEKEDIEEMRKTASIMFDGANNYTCTYNYATQKTTCVHKRAKRKIDNTNKRDLSADLAIMKLFSNTMKRYFPKESIYSNLQSDSTAYAVSDMTVDSLLEEQVKEEIQKSIGKRSLLELTTRHDRLRILKTTAGRHYIFSFPVYIKNQIHYLCSLLWSERFFVRSHLRQIFGDLETLSTNNTTLPSSSNWQASFFAPLERPPLQLMARGRGYEKDLFSPKQPADEFKDLSNQIDNSIRTGQMVKLLSNTDKDKAIYQAMPGRHMSLYTIGARQDISYLFEKIEQHRRMFYIIIVLFLLFAVFAALKIGQAFSKPLEHVLWGLNTVELNNYDVKLNERREDEFGSIARAFNKMVRSLREREFLGAFVSKSVKKLAADPHLFQMAKDGSEQEYTVLFMSFDRFGEYALKFDAERVYKKLEYALDIVFRHVAAAGGEVDKVIGTKILIVFQHSLLGAAKAAKAAANLTKSLAKVFASDRFLRATFGINSGMVISGIIGAPEVRLDNTIIGDPVNVASRLCSLAESTNETTVISGNIQKRLGKEFECVLLENQKIRGKLQVVDVFVLRGQK